ncbi:hypothetical protein ABT112_24470 [Streptomyces sp. NPDC002055]|uniref:hypothetical protein n=1 Tax=Streptomyces sp. NPDC002055 TaxID=3154534 RepID=UPI003317659D
MPNQRPRGYRPRWRPRARTRELLTAVDRILARCAAQLPLTKQTVELLGMARRSGRIPWGALDLLGVHTQRDLVMALR